MSIVPSVKFSQLRVSNWRQFHSIDIDFHPNLTILTGANGAGKTTLLSLLGRHFGWNIAFIATSRRTRRGVYKYFSGKYQSDDEVNTMFEMGRIQYSDGSTAVISVPTEVSESFDVSIVGQQFVDGVFLPSHRPVYSYRRVDQIPTQMDAREQLFEQYFSNLRSMYLPQSRVDSPSFRLKAALISLATFGYGNQVVQSNDQAIETFEGFQRILLEVLPPRLGFERLSIRLPEVVLECSTGVFSLDAASGGIAAIIDLAWQIYMKSLIADGFVAIFDEPENHLHPELQRSILPGFVKAFPHVQFIVATHNPFVVTSVEDSNIFVLDYNDQRVESNHLRDIDKSASANQILTDVLGVPVPIPLWVEFRIDEIVARYENQPISDEMLQGLRSDMATLNLDHLFPDAVGTLLRRKHQ